MTDRGAWLLRLRRENAEQEDALSAVYDERWGEIEETHRTFVERFLSSLPADGRVLDAACGTGKYFGMVLASGRSVLGVDHSAGHLARAREKFPDVPTQRRDLQTLPFREEFDGVMCVDALEMIPPEGYPSVLEGFRRALRPEGRLYLTVERVPEEQVRRGNEEARRAGLPVVDGEVIWEDELYHHYPAMDRVRAWLAEAGFVVDEALEGSWDPEDDYAYHHVLAHLRKGGWGHGVSGAIPSGLQWLRGYPEGRAWLDRLPQLLGECAEEWGLLLGEPYPYAFASMAVPVTRSDGTRAVLKIQFPDRESEHEASALARWDGDGAIRLLAYDADRRALLLERCEPGTPLSDLPPDDALDVMVGLLPRLWKPAGSPFRSLAEEARWWGEQLPDQWDRSGRSFERWLLEAALELLDTLPRSQGEQVLIHQDLHAGNVLRAGREPWLVIDPKPLVGEREFGIAALVRGSELGSGPNAARRRFDRLTADLSLDGERARGWVVAQTLAWAFVDGEADHDHVEVARAFVG